MWRGIFFLHSAKFWNLRQLTSPGWEERTEERTTANAGPGAALTGPVSAQWVYHSSRERSWRFGLCKTNLHGPEIWPLVSVLAILFHLSVRFQSWRMFCAEMNHACISRSGLPHVAPLTPQYWTQQQQVETPFACLKNSLFGFFFQPEQCFSLIII